MVSIRVLVNLTHKFYKYSRSNNLTGIRMPDNLSRGKNRI